MPNRLLAVLHDVKTSATLSEANRRVIQRTIYQDGNVSLSEAGTLFDINDAVDQAACPEWPGVFIGAITDFVLRQNAPLNHIDRSEAVWLVQRLTQDGIVKGETELALIKNLLRYAEGTPAMLEEFALGTIKSHVLSNGFVTAEDVEHLREILYAVGGAGGVAITRMEAELLFDIADATQGQENDASFEDLFVGALANHLMMSAAPARASTEEALRREYWMQQRGDIRSGYKRLLKRASIRDLFSRVTEVEPETQDWLSDTSLGQAEVVTGAESRWLVERLDRDGTLSPLERSLLAFLEAESPDIHRTLAARLRNAA